MRHSYIILMIGIIACIEMATCPDTLQAQRGDNIYLNAGSNGRNSVLRGQITDTSPTGVTIKLSNGKEQQVSPGRIRKMTFAAEPSAMGRARDRMLNGRYDDCLTEISKIKEIPTGRIVLQELEYMKAYCTAQKALRGGDVTAQQAGGAISSFLKKHKSSNNLYPATELLGHLLIAINKPELAEAEFAKLTQSGWPEYVVKGHFFRGNAMIHSNKLDEANASFNAISKVNANDDVSQQYKLIAKCQLAKVMAMSGKAAEARPIIDEIIAKENADNTKLFAYAYNALGHCHLQANQIKPAALAFLHTELLFASEPDPHAEALYNLALIWPKLEDTDRANRARSLLKSRYRNTIWAPKL